MYYMYIYIYVYELYYIYVCVCKFLSFSDSLSLSLIPHSSIPRDVHVSGKTPVHLALAGHPKLNLAMCLKSLGADVSWLNKGAAPPGDVV